MNFLIPAVRRNYLKKILLVIPLYSENLTSLLSPILGQYGLDISDFTQKLFIQTRFYRNELVVRVFMTLFSDNTFIFRIVPISYHVLVRTCLDKIATGNFCPHDIYSILYFYSVISENLSDVFLKNAYFNLKGYLSSYNDLSTTTDIG